MLEWQKQILEALENGTKIEVFRSRIIGKTFLQQYINECKSKETTPTVEGYVEFIENKYKENNNDDVREK